jgi:hypothetical protein
MQRTRAEDEKQVIQLTIEVRVVMIGAPILLVVVGAPLPQTPPKRLAAAA